jgi:hypothetical protein
VWSEVWDIKQVKKFGQVQVAQIKSTALHVYVCTHVNHKRMFVVDYVLFGNMDRIVLSANS